MLLNGVARRVNTTLLAPLSALLQDRNFFMKTVALLIFLLVITASGCSVLDNSERFYRDRPPRAINWREYTSD
jgi:hypothetical protein